MTKSGVRSRQLGFTLVEVCVTIAIIAVLMALLLPAVQMAREAARRASCRSNLRQFGIAIHNYHDIHGQFPIGSGLGIIGKFSYDAGAHRKGSMLVNLLPFIEQGAFSSRIDFGGDVVAQFESDATMRTHVIPLFLCPSDNQYGVLTWMGVDRTQSNYAPSQGSQKMTSNGNSCDIYPGNPFGTGAGKHGDFPDSSLVSGVFSRSVWSARLSDITDGTSNTIAMGEIRPRCSDQHATLGWYSAQAWLVSTSVPINFPTCPGEGAGNSSIPATDCNSWSNWVTSQSFKSRHPGGTHFLLCDGSVRFLSESISLATFQRLGDRRDGEVVGEF
ncbi:MAG: DUF1559 domain-containing protein [Planctomycetota bacterium]